MFFSNHKSGDVVSPQKPISQESPEPSAGGAFETSSNNRRLEQFIKHLISHGFIDNEDDSSETIHRFLEIYESFEGSNNSDEDHDDGGSDGAN